ncbi:MULTISPECIES: hypothetical protein [unclassified Prochlorococcus]|uniref:hypothetical protein n=1 Tax=unclassified Prochlorococcus TaxID=2627481 RepID=UPI0005695215|nr:MULTISPECIES: hypothetical protein [unclassified Prochlorococcus]
MKLIQLLKFTKHDYSRYVLIAIISSFSFSTNAHAGCLFGRCSSFIEASAECRKWSRRGGKVDYSYEGTRWLPNRTNPDGSEPDVPYLNRFYTETWTESVYLRACRHEERTQQYLGWERRDKNLHKIAKECAKNKKRECGSAAFGGEVKAHFRY